MTSQVGRLGRSVDEVAAELGCGWHTVNKEVARWGEALLEADGDLGRDHNHHLATRYQNWLRTRQLAPSPT